MINLRPLLRECDQKFSVSSKFSTADFHFFFLDKFFGLDYNNEDVSLHEEE